ncbi:MAG: hypothetical protein CM15mP45_11410 [Deltaproteobacteria bacterium]|nr:MAG: hypothetical protein CM15mP45_11410 [Deltaproteobacteria bacterium]
MVNRVAGFLLPQQPDFGKTASGPEHRISFNQHRGLQISKKEAARIAVREVRHFLENDSELETVQFVCFSKNDREIYQEILEQDF